MTSPEYQPVDTLEMTTLEKKVELESAVDSHSSGPIKVNFLSISLFIH
jgi:hypothetical protein